MVLRQLLHEQVIEILRFPEQPPAETQRVVYLVSFLILKGFHQCDLPGVVLTCHESITELDQILNLDSNSQC